MIALIEKGRDVAAALGMGGVLWSAYSVSGLPVPATIAQVDARIAAVSEQVKGLKIDQLDSQRSMIRLTRITLRNEHSALERSIASVDVPTKVTMTRRQGEIDDTMKELDATDQDLRERIAELKPK